MTIETPVDGTFEWWMRQVDAEVEHMSGLTSDDMRDMNFRDRFNDGENPHDVAVELLESEGFQFPG